MRPDPGAPTARKILFYLKTKGPQTAAELARRLGVTPMGARLHLHELEAAGDVAYADERRRVGRPARVWRLTEAAGARFPESHAELSVGIIEAARAAFGAAGLERLVAERARRQAGAYRAKLPPRGAPLERRVAALAAIRRDEGYMAEWSREPGGALLLVENNCAICAAARACQGLCGGELDLFRAVLGPRVAVERTEHILSGARRCAYRIRPAIRA